MRKSFMRRIEIVATLSVLALLLLVSGYLIYRFFAQSPTGPVTTLTTSSEQTAPSSALTSAITALIPADLNFVPDHGVRIDQASNPGARLLEDGSVELLYSDNSQFPPQDRVSQSADGLLFPTGEIENDSARFHATKLPDGTWRNYLWDMNRKIFASKYSTDGLHFTAEAGSRYELQADDKGTIGITEVFTDTKGGVVLLYIGDMYGKNRVRRAYSTDKGLTFHFDRDTVFGDAAAQTNQTFVDQKVYKLPAGTFRALVMKQGLIYSFSSPDGDQFSLEEGVRLRPLDFTDLEIVSFHDPVMVRLPDGRYRIYVAARLGTGQPSPGSALKFVIVSATTEK